MEEDWARTLPRALSVSLESVSMDRPVEKWDGACKLALSVSRCDPGCNSLDLDPEAEAEADADAGTAESW